MLQFGVKIRNHSFLPPPPQSPSLSAPASAPTSSLFSHFTQNRVFASPSFPKTYSLFQHEDSRNPLNPKDLFTLSQNTWVSPHPSPKISSRCFSLSVNSATSALKSTHNHTQPDPPSPLQSTLTENRGRGGGTAKRFSIADSRDESWLSPLPFTRPSRITSQRSATHTNARNPIPFKRLLHSSLHTPGVGYPNLQAFQLSDVPTPQPPSTLAPRETRCQNDADK